MWDIYIKDIKNITIEVPFLSIEWTTHKDAEVTLNNQIWRQQWARVGGCEASAKALG